ncbi:MAG: DUF393 domain-containing protein [Bdellovibrionales bacterium]|jgi:predicted DCC family thiol-disulfide oxidoreductase YuxK|nr:DUF393 domain-containing protein [Bdellovibrionales bacterium]
MITIFYDLNCPLCNKIKTFLKLIDIDNKFTFRPIQEESVYLDFPQLNYWDCRQTIHIVNNSGEVFSSENAVLEIIDRVKVIKSGSFFLKTNLGKHLISLLYTALNKYRLEIQKECPDCIS